MRCLIAIPLLATTCLSACAMQSDDEAVPQLGEPLMLAQDSSAVAVSSWLGEEHVLCTGTVLGPDTVMTLASCVSRPEHTHVIIDEDARWGTRLEVESIRTHDGLAFLETRTVMLTLSATLALRPAGDGPLWVEGYGTQGPGASVRGVRRTMELEAYGDALTSATVALCEGDLGAPVFDANGSLVGIVSSVTEGACLPGAGGVRWRGLVHPEPDLDAPALPNGGSGATSD